MSRQIVARPALRNLRMRERAIGQSMLQQTDGLHLELARRGWDYGVRRRRFESNHSG
jgi:hypothetical protein